MKLRKVFSVLICFLMLVAIIPMGALAASPIDANKPATLTIEYIHQDTPVSGAQFDLYLTSSVPSFLEHELDGDFEGFDAQLTGLDTEGWNTLANTLTGYAQLQEIAPVKSGTTNENGILVFEDLTPGLYLAVGQSTEQDGLIYTVNPFLVFLPGRAADSTDWTYEITVRPKSESETPAVEPVSRKVLKVWNDGANAETRPTEITVYLLGNGEVYDTVVLSESNNWEYTWDELDGTAEWTVSEGEVQGYRSTVSVEGVTFVITNTISGSGTVSPDTPGEDPENPEDIIEIPDNPTPLNPVEPGDDIIDIPDDIIDIPDDTPLGPVLPDTGMLWWPVPILITAGVFLLLAGIIIRKKEHNG